MEGTDQGTEMTSVGNGSNSPLGSNKEPAKQEGPFEEAIIETEVHPNRGLVYGITDRPPIHALLVAGLQQGLLGLAAQLAVSIFVADAVCASHDEVLKARILSSTLFMAGLTTLCMVLFGSRLPIFQGAAATYIIPLLNMGAVDKNFCSAGDFVNSTMLENRTEKAIANIQALQGSLMLAGLIQALIGFTGLIGVLLRFVGPITIVPSMLIIGIYITKPVSNFAQVYWPLAFMTLAIAVILFLYLERWLMPIPHWTPSTGFKVIRYPLHQVFAILIAIVIGWIVSAIMTYAGVFSDDPTSREYNARTDARLDGVARSAWFVFPYPGQFGGISFSTPGFIAFIIATVLAILDSVGDYYACARVSRVPPPPAHAVNRGILVEGVCSLLSGALGTGHGTNSYGGNVGAIGVTKVASRWVFIVVGILYLLFGVIGKFSAVFISIPYPVLGGALMTMFGIFTGVVLSNLEVVSLASSRNMAVIGLSVFIGLMIPDWIQKNPDAIDIGSESGNRILSIILTNPNFVGTILACFLDNTVQGSDKERGIEAWRVLDTDEDLDTSLYDHSIDVYDPLLPKAMFSMTFMNYIPFFPNARPKGKLPDTSIKQEKDHCI